MLIGIVTIIVIILLTVGIVWAIDKYVPLNVKPFLQIVLWVFIGWLAYTTYMSVYDQIRFKKIKVQRYRVLIEQLKDIRDAELAHLEITGKYTNSYENLVKFIDTAQYTITQRRDSTILDAEKTKNFGVDMFTDIVIIDTLGYASVKDSLFKNTTRYKTMMNLPSFCTKDSKVALKTDDIDGISVFEASINKGVILHDQDKNLVRIEKEDISIENVRGESLKVGSLTEVNTNGNWPKTFAND
jgi:energy-coupling factor transporter transmembrane protein EcfT